MADLVGFRAWCLDQADLDVDANLKAQLNAQGAGITLTKKIEVSDNQPGHIQFNTDHRVGPARSELIDAFINRAVWVVSSGSNKKAKTYKFAIDRPNPLT